MDTQPPPPGTQIGQEGDGVPCAIEADDYIDLSTEVGSLPSPNALFGAVYGTVAATATPPEGAPVDFDLLLILDTANSTLATHWYEVTPEGADTECTAEGWTLTGPIPIEGAPAFEGTNHGTLDAASPDAVALEVAIVPTGDWEPATLAADDWAQLELVITGTYTGSWSGELTWVGTNPGHSRTELAATWSAP